MNIDWSKAPTGATHYFTEGEFPWRDLSGINWRWFANGNWYADNSVSATIDMTSVGFLRRNSKFLITKPQSNAWTGEGLPPVGTVLELFYCGAEQGKATVRYIGDNAAVFYSEERECEQCGMLDRYKFKPIRTAEQIAAEEREKVIKEIFELLLTTPWENSKMAAALYDAGYRKQVTT